MVFFTFIISHNLIFLHSFMTLYEHLHRCIMFLLLPQFFSKRGRQALMAYAFILTLTGPAKNILHNISILSESLACGQVSFYRWVLLCIPLMSLHLYTMSNVLEITHSWFYPLLDLLFNRQWLKRTISSAIFLLHAHSRIHKIDYVFWFVIVIWNCYY